MIKLKDLLNEESAMKAIINAKKGAKASGGGYSPWTKIGNNSWKNKKTGRLAHNAGLYDRIGEFSDFVIEGKLNEISAMAGLKDVMKGTTSAIEGVKMSKAVAAGLINWIQMSPYGKRYSNQIKNARIHSLIGPANSMGIDRYLGSKGKSEWKVLFAKHGPKRESVNESYNQSDVNYAMKMAFDSIPGNWHKALKRVKYSKRSKSIQLNMSSYMGPGKVLQKIVNEFNRSMGTKYKIDKDSFVKGSITSIELREK